MNKKQKLNLLDKLKNKLQEIDEEARNLIIKIGELEEVLK